MDANSLAKNCNEKYSFCDDEEFWKQKMAKHNLELKEDHFIKYTLEGRLDDLKHAEFADRTSLPILMIAKIEHKGQNLKTDGIIYIKDIIFHLEIVLFNDLYKKIFDNITYMSTLTMKTTIFRYY